MLPELTHLLTYNNPKILNRYTKDFPHNTLNGDEAFAELLKYFWLCEKHKLDSTLNPHNEELKFDCVIHREMYEIDNMWHTFLLFTHEYMIFCQTFFDDYIHHLPSDNEVDQLKLMSVETELNRYLSYIYDHLGQETVEKWFSSLLK